MPISLSFKSTVFDVEALDLEGHKEQIVRGGRHLFPLLPKAFDGRQADRRHRLGLAGAGAGAEPARLARGHRHQGQGRPAPGLVVDAAGARGRLQRGRTARSARCSSRDRESDLVLLLISDAAHGRAATEEVFESLKPGATLGLSHGFLLGHMRTSAPSSRPTSTSSRVCPKGMGPSRAAAVRAGQDGQRRRHQRQLRGGAGHRRQGHRSARWAGRWRSGSPYTFQTTLESEYKSDIYGERGILLGAVHGIVESLYRRFVAQGMSKEDAFRQLALSRSPGPISRIISKNGIMAVTSSSTPMARPSSRGLRAHPTRPARAILAEIYDEVSSGNEIRSVVMAGERLKTVPMGSDRRHREPGRSARRCARARDEDEIPLDPFTAGVYIATMMAQIDMLHGERPPVLTRSPTSPSSRQSTRSTRTCTRAASRTWSTTARPRRVWARASGRRASTTR